MIRAVVGRLASVLLAGCVALTAAAQTAPEAQESPRTRAAQMLADELGRHPLRPPATSSPRATLQTFVNATELGVRIVLDAHAENIAAPGLFNEPAAVVQAREGVAIFKLAVATLDLSAVPKTLRDDVGVESALMLKEIVDRIELPPWSDVPDKLALDAEELKDGDSFVWRIPNTDLEIARVLEGPRKGEFLFTPETVSRLPEFYARVRHLPYKSTAYVTEGVYDFYISTPGSVLPPKWSHWLPDWSNRLFYQQTIWQWVVSIVLLAVAVRFLIALYRRLRRRAESKSAARRQWGRVAFYVVIVATIAALRIFLDDEINLTGRVLVVTGTVLETISWLALALGAFFTGNAVAEHLIESPKIDTESIQASYLRAVFGLVGFIAGAAVAIYGLREVGVSLVPVLTGVGIGGLAIALAARPTIENIIGSFMIFADKPYRVGQRVKVMGQDGFVESIGLRSTKIRLMNGHLTSIPNEKMATAEIENVGRRQHIRRVFDVTVTYDTSPEKMHRAVEILREILSVPEAPDDTHGDGADREPHPNEGINQPGLPPRVYFSAFNADSLNIMVMYWFHPPRRWQYFEHAHWINMQILERFNAEGIDFAFPTQTLHLAGDEKRPLTIGRRWVTESAELSHSDVLAQAAAIGARTALAGEFPISEASRPKPGQGDKSGSDLTDEFGDEPVEDDLLDDAGGGDPGSDR